MIDSKRYVGRGALALMIGATVLGVGGSLQAAPPALQGATGAARNLPFLPELRGDFVTVRYTTGSLDRAVRVQRRLEPLVQDFSKWGGRFTGLSVVLLSRAEWKETGLENPYGLPGALGGHLALPAWGDKETVGVWRQLLGQPLPTLEGNPVRGTADEAASLLLCDQLAEVDAARLLLAAGGYSYREAWVGAVMAHALAWGAVLRHEAGRRGQVEELFALVGRSAEGVHRRSLERFARPADLAERLWFEARFFAAVGVLSGPNDPQVGKKLLKRGRKQGGRVTAADLLQWYPGLTVWLERSFAG